MYIIVVLANPTHERSLQARVLRTGLYLSQQTGWDAVAFLFLNNLGRVNQNCKYTLNMTGRMGRSLLRFPCLHRDSGHLILRHARTRHNVEWMEASCGCLEVCEIVWKEWVSACLDLILCTEDGSFGGPPVFCSVLGCRYGGIT